MNESKCPECGSHRVHSHGFALQIPTESGVQALPFEVVVCSDCGWNVTAKEDALQAEIERLRGILTSLVDADFVDGPPPWIAYRAEYAYVCAYCNCIVEGESGWDIGHSETCPIRAAFSALDAE